MIAIHDKTRLKFSLSRQITLIGFDLTLPAKLVEKTIDDARYCILNIINAACNISTQRQSGLWIQG